MDKLVSVRDFQTAADDCLHPIQIGYYNCGSDNEVTLQDNCNAFQRIKLNPRVCVDVSEGSTVCGVLGFDLNMPIGIAPTALHRMANLDGEIATAKAAGKAGTIYIQSSYSTFSLEEVSAAAPDTIKWFQLFIYKQRSITESLIRRAEAAGYKALVLTIDQPMMGQRRFQIKNNFQVPKNLRLANFVDTETEFENKSSEFVETLKNNSLTWKDVKWLISFTKLPVIVKGILRAEDAVIASDIGCSGIIVSNHGARQLDTVLSTIEALPAIAKSVGHRLAVMMDGGIRDGTDVFKAIAYGAKCVFVGRPVLWGLAVDGQSGVERVLEILKDEFGRAMSLSGTITLADISTDYLATVSKL